MAAAISLTSPETLEAWGVSEAGLASGAVTADSKAVFCWIAEWEGISELEEKIEVTGLKSTVQRNVDCGGAHL